MEDSKSEFRLKDNKEYPIWNDDPSMTISNKTMSDERAIIFLYFDHSRIELFSKYSENWESLIVRFEMEVVTEVEKMLDEQSSNELILQVDLPEKENVGNVHPHTYWFPEGNKELLKVVLFMQKKDELIKKHLQKNMGATN